MYHTSGKWEVTETIGTNIKSGDVFIAGIHSQDKRVEGARIYFKESGTAERFLLAEFNLIDGVKGALDSTFTPWDENSEIYDLSSNMLFDDPPSVYSYVTLNGYYANEMYNKSSEILCIYHFFLIWC